MHLDNGSAMAIKRKVKGPAVSRAAETSRLVSLFLPGLAAVIAYANTVGHGFVYDDINGILQNPMVTRFAGFSDLLAALSQPWRSTVFLSFAVTHYFFGFDARLFHLSNVLIHAVNAVLVYSIAREVAHLWINEDKVERFALAAGLFFALHPLNSEAVAYLWGRSSSLCGMFYFSSLLAAMIACRKTTRIERMLWACGALMAGFLAWRTKEEAITLPLAIAGFLFLRGHRRAAIAVFVSPLLIVLLRFSEIIRIFGEVGENRELVLAGAMPALTPGIYLLTHITANVFYYSAKFILPVGLNADPTIKAVTTLFDMHFILALTCLIILGTVCLASMRRKRILSFSLWVLIASPLAAYSFIPLADVVAEHRAYISGLGYALVLATAILWKPRSSGAVMLVVSLLFGITTIVRNRVWADSLSLWSDTERRSPTLARPHLNLGVAYEGEGRFEEALAEFDHALSINPKLAPALVNRGAIFFQRGELDRAEAELMKAIGVAPERAISYLNLASIALARKQPDAALAWLNKSIAFEDTAASRFTLGETLLQLGRFDDAAREYQHAAALSRADPELGARVEQRLRELRNRDLIR